MIARGSRLYDRLIVGVGINPDKATLFSIDERVDLVRGVTRAFGNVDVAKFEGLAFGPDLPDGRRLLLVTADNDFLPDQPFRLYAFAVGRADLPGYRPQEFAPRP